jgi:16S rRNA (uracil1498-N3)-methyltransferase
MDAYLIYVLHDEAGKPSFKIDGELYKYLIKVRRHEAGDTLSFRNKDEIKTLYGYKIETIGNRSLVVELISSAQNEIKSKKSLHIAWCIIDTKSVEKVLPSLCEIGVEKISFIECDRSQRNFKLDFKRFDRILEASMQQCGRTSFIEFNTYKNLKDFLSDFPQTKVFDFCDNVLKDGANFETVLIGCEGGFSKFEKEFLKKQEIFALDTPMVLRSESAVMAVASKILL